MLQQANVSGRDFVNCINGEGCETTHATKYGISVEDSKKIYSEITGMLKTYTLRKERKIAAAAAASPDEPQQSPQQTPPHKPKVDRGPSNVMTPPCKHEGVPPLLPGVVAPGFLAEIKKKQPENAVFNTKENRAVASTKVEFVYNVPESPQLDVPIDIVYEPPAPTQTRFPIQQQSAMNFFVK